MNLSLLKRQGLDKIGYYIGCYGEEMARSKILDIKWFVLSKKTDFSFSGFIGNTLDSHCLIWKAMDEGRSDLQDRVLESIFRAHFEEYNSLGGPLVLNYCTERVCMGVILVLRDRNDAGQREVEEDME